MRRSLLRIFLLLFALTGLVSAQGGWPKDPDRADTSVPSSFTPPGSNLASPLVPADRPDDIVPAPLTVPLPRMAPELALQAYRGGVIVQTAHLASYSANTLIHAELPDTKQSGVYEVTQRYSSPHQLTFKAVRFTGDNFVKSNVILRVLQSEVDHVQKDDPATNAINATNYKFTYKGTSQLNGRMVHVYQLKPRQKRSGLFKGKMYLDVYSGNMVRAEGRLVKSPSLFVKKLEFVQDYSDFDTFTFPVHIHSEALARIVGRTVVDIYFSDYQAVSAAEAKASSGF